MKITKITQQIKQANRYSVFLEGKYVFSLSETALLESGIASGQELTDQQVNDYKKLSADDKIYALALRYAAMRPRSKWEVAFYLERKEASPTLIDNILSKLSKVGLIDDEAFARMFVSDRQHLRPSSRRKILLDLKKKRVSESIVQKVLEEQSHDERSNIRSVITQKRRQSKYQDDLKLMQYLARQGFNYGDIKDALQVDHDLE